MWNQFRSLSSVVTKSLTHPTLGKLEGISALCKHQKQIILILGFRHSPAAQITDFHGW